MINLPSDSKLESQLQKEAAKNGMQTQEYVLHLLHESINTKAHNNRGNSLWRRAEDTIQGDIKDQLRKRGYEWR